MCRFPNTGDDWYVLVGVARDMILNPKSVAGGFIYTYRLISGGEKLEFVHKVGSSLDTSLHHCDVITDSSFFFLLMVCLLKVFFFLLQIHSNSYKIDHVENQHILRGRKRTGVSYQRSQQIAERLDEEVLREGLQSRFKTYRTSRHTNKSLIHNNCDGGRC